jgi:two-component system, OmpR family, sensor histidine kinase TctE
VADPILLAELLRNLLSNAIVHAGRGAVVTVRVVTRPQETVLEVEDNGPGLTQAQMDMAVESRRGASRPVPHLTGSGANGMGLGLAVAVEISALFQARLRLERPGSGSGLKASIAFAPLAA